MTITADYYVDLAAAYDHTKVGTSTGEAWGGAVGLQRAVDNVGDGDLVAVKGEADLRKLQVVTYDNLAGGTFSAGDTVTESGSASWAGTVYEDNGSTQMTIEVTSGTPANNDSFDNGSGVSADVNGAPSQPGIIEDSAGGEKYSPVIYRGVNSSWEEGYGDTSYQATLDAHSAATNCMNISQRYKQIDNFTFKNATGNNMTNSSERTLVRYCISQSAGSEGFHTGDERGTFYRCIAHNSTNYGFNLNCKAAVILCTAEGGSSGGIATYYSGSVYGCLAYGNSGRGFYIKQYGVIFNCVADNNGGHGIEHYGSGSIPALTIGCRVTNNTGTGIYGGGDCALGPVDWCVVYGNGSGIDSVLAIGENNDQSPADDGYVDQSSQDYNLADGAEISAEASDSEIVLEWDA